MGAQFWNSSINFSIVSQLVRICANGSDEHRRKIRSRALAYQTSSKKQQPTPAVQNAPTTGERSHHPSRTSAVAPEIEVQLSGTEECTHEADDENAMTVDHNEQKRATTNGGLQVRAFDN